MNQRYSNAPIREAVCEFRFQSGSPWDLATPGLVYAALRPEYPRRVHTQGGVATTVTLGPQGVEQETQPVQNPGELRFWRDSEGGVIRVRPNILSISHYQQYSSWEAFRLDILKVLRAYRSVTEPAGLERVGLRYINEFNFEQAVDGHSIDLDQFFDIGPKVGERLRQDLGSFFVGIQYLFDDDRDSLRIQMQPGSLGEPQGTKITLDLDYFLRESGQITLDSVEGWIDAAHQRISESFEGCIKEDLRQRLQPAGG